MRLLDVLPGWGATLVVGATLSALAGVQAGEQARSDGTRPSRRLSRRDHDLVELGRRLFFDPGVSARGTHACASCHDPEHGFGDSARRSADDGGPTRRHSQALIDVQLGTPQHWDGEFESVADLAHARITTPADEPGGYGDGRSGRRMPRSGSGSPALTEGTTSRVGGDLGRSALGVGGVSGGLSEAVADGAARLSNGQRYGEALRTLGEGSRFGVEFAAQALEAFVGSIASGRSAFDRHRAGEERALSPMAQRGFEIFRGRGQCSACHQLESEGDWPLLRDGAFHNTGVSWQGDGAGFLGSRMVLELMEGKALLDLDGLDAGRHGVREGDGMLRAFKTPSLRDVARHPPYFHDGSRARLEDVVRHYATGCGDDPDRDSRLKGFPATDEDVSDLVAFLESLTSEERPGLASGTWAARAERTRLRFLDPSSRPIAGLTVRLELAGDRVPGAKSVALPTELVTDAEGEIAYEVPARTHVRMRLPRDLMPLGGSFVPDTCRKADVRVPAQGTGRIALVVGAASLGLPEVLRAYVPVGPAVPLGGGGHERSGSLVIDDPWTLQRVGLVQVGARRVALYEGWMRSPRESPALLLRLPNQDKPQRVRLRADETLRFEVTP